MIWKTTNALGQEVTWYSEDEYFELWKTLDDVKDLLEQYLKWYGCNNEVERALAKINEGLENGQESN